MPKIDVDDKMIPGYLEIARVGYPELGETVFLRSGVTYTYGDKRHPETDSLQIILRWKQPRRFIVEEDAGVRSIQNPLEEKLIMMGPRQGGPFRIVREILPEVAKDSICPRCGSEDRDDRRVDFTRDEVCKDPWHNEGRVVDPEFPEVGETQAKEAHPSVRGPGSAIDNCPRCGAERWSRMLHKCKPPKHPLDAMLDAIKEAVSYRHCGCREVRDILAAMAATSPASAAQRTETEE